MTHAKVFGFRNMESPSKHYHFTIRKATFDRPVRQCFRGFQRHGGERAVGGKNWLGRAPGRQGIPVSTRRARSSPRHARGLNVS